MDEINQMAKNAWQNAIIGGLGAHEKNRQQLRQGQASRLRQSLRITTHLYAEQHGVLRVPRAKLRALAHHLDHRGSIGCRQVLPPPVLRQDGGGVNMTTVPHEGLGSREG